MALCGTNCEVNMCLLWPPLKVLHNYSTYRVLETGKCWRFQIGSSALC